MMRAIAVGALGCLAAACQGQASGETTAFSVRARYVPIIRTVVLTLTNRSSDYLCVATADHFFDSGLIEVLPASKYDILGNRPPPQLIGDFDVSAGVEVVLPNRTRDLSLDLSQHEGRQPHATSVRGKVRATLCRELFSSNHPQATEQTLR
jgi:hypothetical protein